MESIEGRVALVTGGGRGIGRAVALALARAGADVAVAARTVPEIEAVAAEKLGPVEILVNNAGMHASAPVQRTDDATWAALLAVDLTAPFLLTRACLPAMYERHWGRIINVASVAGRIGLKYGSAYAAAKHGLIGFTRSVALEGAKKGVTANAICPSWTETQMMDEAVEAISSATGRTPAQAREAILASNPIGRAALD